MSSEWLSGTPSVVGWYPASTEGSATCRRYWDGSAWSAPVFGGDPREHWIRAMHTPASTEGNDEIRWLDDSVDRERIARWLMLEQVEITPEVAACPDRFVATNLLEAAAGHIRARAVMYDKPEGERSMERTVQAFNAVTGHTVSESQGWLFMELLKAVRDFTTQGGHADSQEDRIAYAALGAEARRAGK